MMQVCAIIMIIFSVLGKFCAVFVTIPDPMLGGIYIVMFGKLLLQQFSYSTQKIKVLIFMLW